MANASSLLFLPDISGFTKFVHQTAIQHSQHITAELLELLIDANELGLTLAEIEGDALFFYKKDEIPSKEAFLKQVQNMFVKFHTHLKLYEKRRICQCGACCMAASLQLKFIAHAGHFDLISIKDHRKPYGTSVIEAHRLMKNNVPIEEYVLLSEDLLKVWKDAPELSDEWEQPKVSQSEYGELGKIDYRYIPLANFQQYAKAPPPIEDFKMDTPLRLQTFVNRPVNEAFELVTNFDYRQVWNLGTDGIEYDKNRVNRVGTKHLCVVDDELISFETTNADFGEGKLVYGEKLLKKIPGIKDLVNYFILESQKGGTLLTLELHYKAVPVIGWMILPILKRKLKQNLQQLLSSFKKVADSEFALAQA